MRRAKEIKEDLLAALEAVGDGALAETGFKRSKRSVNYVRRTGDARQTIAFTGDYVPRYQPGAELCLLPQMHLAMKPVTEAALRLVAGDAWLLANAPDIIVNQPITFTAPKDARVPLVASGLGQMTERVDEICGFVNTWVVPFVDVITTPNELIGIYENADDRMMKQRHWYLFIAAAHLVNGNAGTALTVLQDNLGAPGLRRRFSVAFETLESMLSGPIDPPLERRNNRVWSH